MARVAAPRAVADPKLLILAERSREVTRRRLRREVWMNAGTAAGIGAALVALVWREGAAIAPWVEQGLAATSDMGALAGLAFVALGFGAWIALQRFMPR
jgi:hypothetical protein